MTDIASGPRRVPEKPTLAGLEQRWSRQWQEEGTYAFDRSKDRADVYAIDTPPPTVSGNLHIGHVYSFTHTDLIARFQRMRGKAVFFPIGWDDNGLPTERRMQDLFGMRCDPALPYDPDFTPPSKPDSRHPVAISRRNFEELCARQTLIDETAYEHLWRRLGLSYDWAHHYTTNSAVARATAQRGFLRNLARGEAYTAEAPSLWDVSFGTAVAQADLEDREVASVYYRLRFDGPDGPLEVETTRPELLPACVALVCHPDDARFADLVGGTGRTPLFGAEVPILSHAAADPEKGTGLVMVCTFGDLTDVTWWRDLNLDTRVIVGRDGRLLAAAPPTVDARPYGELAGLPVNQARGRIVELLGEAGALIGEPRPIRHPVKFYERGDRPLEIVSSRQWYIRNGGRDPKLRDELLELGRQLRWVPEHMRHRYEHWLTGLTGDWIISRQRFLGPPFPVWYRLDANGVPDYDKPLTPDESRLPIDPWIDAPDGYTEAQRGEPGGFVGDPDVMDTWATSSLSPQLAGGWERDPDLFKRVFPMDLRPQAHEIIRTWLFSTVVRARAEHGQLPWHTADISGWIVEPKKPTKPKREAVAAEDRIGVKKISKSSGATGPQELLDLYGSDAVRYWAATGRSGVDMTFDEAEVKVGRRLATKLLNAARFVLGLAQDETARWSSDREEPSVSEAPQLAHGAWRSSDREEPSVSEAPQLAHGAWRSSDREEPSVSEAPQLAHGAWRSSEREEPSVSEAPQLAHGAWQSSDREEPSVSEAPQLAHGAWQSSEREEPSVSEAPQLAHGAWQSSEREEPSVSEAPQLAHGAWQSSEREEPSVSEAPQLAHGAWRSSSGSISEPVDLALLARLRRVVATATDAFLAYDHTLPLTETEAFFWEFCDDFVELVKERAYGEGPAAASARATLQHALTVQLRLFSPFLPYVTEEIWSWYAPGSVHRAAWPDPAELPGGGDEAILTAVSGALTQIRRAKSDLHLSMRANFGSATVSGPADELDRIASAEADLRAAGRIGQLTLRPETGPLTITCSV